MDVETSATTSLIRKAILEYLQRTGHANRLPNSTDDPEVAKRVRDTIQSMNHGLSERRVEAYTTAALTFAIYGFRHIPSIEIRTAIAVYTFCCLGADDDSTTHKTATQEFAARFLSGTPQFRPILDRLVESVNAMMPHYTAYSGAVFATNTIECVSAQVFVDHNDVALGPEAGEYLEYIRRKHGLGEAFTALVWPEMMFPETKTYIAAIAPAVEFFFLQNDLLSHYKEFKGKEVNTYMSNLASLNNYTEAEALQNVVDRLIDSRNRVKTILGESSPEWEAWDGFTTGFTKAYFVARRYALDEVVPEYC